MSGPIQHLPGACSTTQANLEWSRFGSRVKLKRLEYRLQGSGTPGVSLDFQAILKPGWEAELTSWILHADTECG